MTPAARLLALGLLACCHAVRAQDFIEATGGNGQKYHLYPDGTWRLNLRPGTTGTAATPAQPLLTGSDGMGAPPSGLPGATPGAPLLSGTAAQTNAKVFIKDPIGAFGIWIDPEKWKRNDLEQDDSKMQFHYFKGDAYVTVITERASLPLETVKKLALANGKAAAPDLQVLSEEKRLVNGHEVLRLKLTGTLQGLHFVYLNCYYGGPEGSIQVMSYTYQNLFDDYRPELEDFLDGLRIGGT